MRRNAAMSLQAFLTIAVAAMVGNWVGVCIGTCVRRARAWSANMLRRMAEQIDTTPPTTPVAPSPPTAPGQTSPPTAPQRSPPTTTTPAAPTPATIPGQMSPPSTPRTPVAPTPPATPVAPTPPTVPVETKVTKVTEAKGVKKYRPIDCPDCGAGPMGLRKHGGGYFLACPKHKETGCKGTRSPTEAEVVE